MLNEKGEKGGQITFIAESHGCRATMNKEQQAWDTHPEYTHVVLCFCLTAAPQKKESALHGMKNPFSQEGKSGSAIALPFDQFELGHVSLHHAVIDPPG
jgi:hypothetical protein